jgi:hypothetical protein
MKTKQELIAQLDSTRAQMEAWIPLASTEDEVYPGWTMRQVLAHIAGWDEATLAALRAHSGGHESGTPAAQGIDSFNAQSVETREVLSFEQTRREFDVNRAEVKQAILDTPEDKFFEKMILPWGGYGTVESIVNIFAEHEEEHAEEIRKAMVKE